MSKSVLLVLVSWAVVFVGRCTGQSHGFSYQGRLTERGAPANGLYDFRFAAYNAQTLGSLVGVAITNSAVSVSNGLFTTVVNLDAGVFTGPPRWLDIGLRTNGSLAEFQFLTDRQLISATPYALYALSAGSISIPLPASRTSPQTLHVDALAGDDSTQGRITGRPFKSISNALAAAINGDVVHIKAGRYTNQLHYYPVYSYGYLFSGKSNVTVCGDGPGTVIYGAGPGTFFGVGGNCDNITFRDFTIEGSKGDSSAGRWITNGLVAGIRFFGSNVRNCVVERVTMKNLPNHGVASFHSTDPDNIIIRNCYFENGGATNGVLPLDHDGAAIVLEGQRWQAIDNVIRNWARGIELYTPSADLHGLVARGNRILQTPWQGIAVFPENGARICDSIINDNIIEGHPASSLVPQGMLLSGMERCVISGNRVSRFNGIGIFAANTFRHNAISGNAIYSCGSGITLWDVTAATNMAHNTISYNNIDVTDHSAISVNGVNNSVLYNHITSPNRAGLGTPGIRSYLGSTNLWCSVIGNTIADAGIGIWLETGVLTNRVSDNHMPGVATPLIDWGSGTTVRSNTQ